MIARIMINEGITHKLNSNLFVLLVLVFVSKQRNQQEILRRTHNKHRHKSHEERKQYWNLEFFFQRIQI